MGSKRNPMTAAKREREQAVKDRRKRKLEKKQAAAAARAGSESVNGDAADHASIPAPSDGQQ